MAQKTLNKNIKNAQTGQHVESELKRLPTKLQIPNLITQSQPQIFTTVKPEN